MDCVGRRYENVNTISQFEALSRKGSLEFRVVYLRRRIILGYQEVSGEFLNFSLFKEAASKKASSIVCLHYAHVPSEFFDHDCNLAKTLLIQGKISGIRLTDFVIVGLHGRTPLIEENFLD